MIICLAKDNLYMIFWCLSRRHGISRNISNLFSFLLLHEEFDRNINQFTFSISRNNFHGQANTPQLFQDFYNIHIYSSIQRSTTLGYLEHLRLKWFCEPHSRYFFIIISKPENSVNSTQDTIISGY